MLPSHALIGTVQLNAGAGAETYKVKIKAAGRTKYEIRVSAGEPFRINRIASGTYDLVVEANGHTTFVKPDFINIGTKKVERVNIEMIRAKTIFLKGDATKIIMCSACHKKIYMEMIRGEGTVFHSGLGRTGT